MAQVEKERIEQKQRQERKSMEQKGLSWSPRWFDFELRNKKVLKCKYRGNYWSRERESAEANLDLF